MTRGELFTRQFDVTPCDGGSFLVRVPSDDGAKLRTYAFTNIADLMAWFQHHAQLSQQPQQQPQNLKDQIKARLGSDSKPIPLPGPGKQKGNGAIRRLFHL